MQILFFSSDQMQIGSLKNRCMSYDNIKILQCSTQALLDYRSNNHSQLETFILRNTQLHNKECKGMVMRLASVIPVSSEALVTPRENSLYSSSTSSFTFKKQLT